MPELPEVELVTRSLNKLISRQVIIKAELLRERLAPETTPFVFNKKLINCQINAVQRRGKFILIKLENDLTIIVHLRMTGRFMLFPAEAELPKHTHAIFYFSDESKLIFQDQRHFGFMKILATKELNQSKELKNLAPEPFSDEFNVNYLKKILLLSKRPIKEFLLDQTKVCGLGNIYVSESLFLSKIHPEIEANKIPKHKIIKLFNAIRYVLNESIAHGSTLNVDPQNIDGSYYGGSYEGQWRVYNREKSPCSICRFEIMRIVQAGRSSFYCPKCQK